MTPRGLRSAAALALLVLLVLLVILVAGEVTDRDGQRREYLGNTRREFPEVVLVSDMDLLSYGNAICDAYQRGWNDERVARWLVDVPANYLGVDGQRLSQTLPKLARSHLCPLDA